MAVTNTTPETSFSTIPRRVFPHHLAELRRSGLSDETIRAAGVFSEDNAAKLAAILDWRGGTKKLVPAIVFPYRDRNGANGYLRIKPDRPRVSGGKPIKYESPKGQPNRIYLPPGIAQRLEDSAIPVVISEGEKKALKAAQEGFCCVGLVGVFGWKEKGREALLAELERIPWKSRPVYIAFDSDAAEKPEVKDAGVRLAAQLANRGAEVKMVQLPQGPPGEDGKPTKVGLDDFLVAHDVAELHKLLNAAETPEPPDPATVKIDAKNMDPQVAAEEFLASAVVDGVSRLRYWRGSFWLWHQGAYRELPNAELQARLVRELNRNYCALSGRRVSDTMMQLRAQSLLGGANEPPAWIDEPPMFGDDKSYWPADDVLVAKNAMVCLPRLVEGRECITPPTPRFLSTVSLDYDFSPDATAPTAWLEFLGQLWPDDPQSVDTVAEWFGYCLTADTSQQKILLLVGPRRSGKGTIARVLRGMIGPANMAGPTLSSFGTNFGLWPLLGKSLAVVSDARLSHRVDSSIVVERLLSISGEDPLTVDRKCMEPVTCKLSTRLMILTNELPRLTDSSGALAGRMVVLRLTESFYGREDRGLTARLLGELPGILLWSIEGWRRLNERGHFVQPTAADTLRQEMQDLASPVGVFLRDTCVVGPEYRVSVDDLFNGWREWCGQHGRKEPGTEQSFGRDLLAAIPGLNRVRPREGGERVRAYQGLGLKTQW